MNIKILDCTLRDGGYINNWDFGKKNIRNIVKKLISSNVDNIEVGFLDKRVDTNSDKTITSEMLHFNKILYDIDKKNTKIFAMIDYGTFDIDSIVEKEKSVLDGIRVIFTQDKIEEAINFCSKIRKKGYIVFANAVNITNYKEKNFKKLFDEVNKTQITGVSIVDTYGILSPTEALNIYKKFDKNINKEMIIGFHAHNTLQLAMGNCLEIIKNINPNRETYIDSTLCGMGKGSGNAYTEILIKFLNTIEKNYELSPILDLLQNEMNTLIKNYSWNYSLCRFVSSINNIYYKYTDYYQKTKKLDLNKIERIESYINEEDKYSFSPEKAEMYLELYDKPKYNAVIFDIDGTILDTTSGILSAIDYTIKKCNLKDLDYNSKLKFIGPPIQDSFKKTYNLTDEETKKIAKVFRDRYKNNDLYKAEPYDGILKLLKELKEKGVKVGIATYKREDYTLDLMNYFGIDEYCDSIHGSDFEGKLSKYDIIKKVINEINTEQQKTVMIGDCETDYIGAKENKIDFIGVTYGFGFKNDEPSKTLARNVNELKEYLL